MKMAFLKINSLNLKNSLLNYTYSTDFQMKPKNKMTSKLLQKKNSQENFEIMFQICIHGQKVQRKEPTLCF